MSTQEAFDKIYRDSEWGYKSGDGSNPDNAQVWIDHVNKLLVQDDIYSVLDVGCGDWRIGQRLNLYDKWYIGMDASRVIIDEVRQYEANNIHFICANAEQFNFPNFDLILVKDVLQHLPNSMVTTIVDKVIASSKYALLCNDVSGYNTDTHVGGYRAINLNKPPFNYNFINLDLYQSGTFLKLINFYQRDMQ